MPSFNFDAYITMYDEIEKSLSGAYKGKMPYVIAVDGDIVNAWADLSETDPFGLGVKLDIPDKPSPEDLNLEITTKEKAGAAIYIIKKNNSSWYIEFFNNKFYLNSFAINMKEKVQIQETLGPAVVSFFGDSVRIYEFGGVALDWTSANTSQSYKNFHQSGLIHMYNNVLRGTKLVEANRIAVLTVGNHYVYGYPLNLAVSYSSEMEKIAVFRMSWVVVDHTMNYPFLTDESDLENLYKVDVKYKDRYDNFESIDIPKELNKVTGFNPDIERLS